MPMKGFKSNIEKDTLENTLFRKVMYTGHHLQLVLMNIQPGEDIGEETHINNDQFFRFESGAGKCIIDGNEYLVKEGDAVVVPAGAKHNVINTSHQTPLKMYTLYGPPNHRDAVGRTTKHDAERLPEVFDGKASE